MNKQKSFSKLAYYVTLLRDTDEKYKRIARSQHARLVEFFHRKYVLVLYALVGLCMCLWVAGVLILDNQNKTSTPTGVVLSVNQQADTLVLYTFAATDGSYIGNLNYFLANGIQENDGCDYKIVLQVGQDSPKQQLNFQQLPSNVEIIEHNNECFDSGTSGWVIHNLDLQWRQKYKYIIWMNSSVRGPFKPVYASDIHWTKAFTGKLNDDVKLVGSTINCGFFDHPTAGHVSTPHIQSYVVATDQVGVSLLLDAGVFNCHESYFDAVVNSEMKASQVILKAGYNIDSLMQRYQGVDWRNPDFQNCNDLLSPLPDNANDGISVSPYEVMFIKVKDELRHSVTHQSIAEATKISQWTQIGDGNKEYGRVIRNNMKQADVARAMLMGIKAKQSCVDVNYTQNFQSQIQSQEFNNIFKESSQSMANYLLSEGFFEGVPYKFNC